MTVTTAKKDRLPGSFADLLAVLPPRAIADDTQLERMAAMIDRLMAIDRLTKGQAAYLETLVQLVEAYEAKHHGIDVSDISGIDSLRHLLEAHSLNATDLARLLGVHPSLGSKLLKGDRSLTLEHVKLLSAHFKVQPGLFM